MEEKTLKETAQRLIQSDESTINQGGSEVTAKETADTSTVKSTDNHQSINVPSKSLVKDEENSQQPGIPSAQHLDSQLPEIPSAQSVNTDSFLKKAQYAVISQGRTVSLFLGVVIAVVALLVIVHDRNAKAQLLQKYMDEAELLEYDEQHERASVVWHKAIDLMAALGEKGKRLADVHVRAAHEEGKAAELIYGILFMSHTVDKSELERLGKKKSALESQEINDLRAASSLYESVPSTAAEQISTLSGLIPLIEAKFPEFSNSLSDSPHFVALINSAPSAEATESLARADNELEAKKLDLAIVNYRKYIHDTRDSAAVRNSVFEFARTYPHDATVRRSLIPISHEIIYYDHTDPRVLQYEHDWLNSLIYRTGKDPASYKDRLSLADEAFSQHDYPGAIVEYMLCLGMHDDSKVRDKLIESIQLVDSVDIKNTDIILEYLQLNTKLKNLDERAFGTGALQVMEQKVRLGRAYWLANDLSNAEKTLTSIKPGAKERNLKADIALYLADVYAKAGRCEDAVFQ